MYPSFLLPGVQTSQKTFLLKMLSTWLKSPIAYHFLRYRCCLFLSIEHVCKFVNKKKKKKIILTWFYAGRKFAPARHTQIWQLNERYCLFSISKYSDWLSEDEHHHAPIRPLPSSTNGLQLKHLGSGQISKNKIYRSLCNIKLLASFCV